MQKVQLGLIRFGPIWKAFVFANCPNPNGADQIWKDRFFNAINFCKAKTWMIKFGRVWHLFFKNGQIQKGPTCFGRVWTSLVVFQFCIGFVSQQIPSFAKIQLTQLGLLRQHADKHSLRFQMIAESWQSWNLLREKQRSIQPNFAKGSYRYSSIKRLGS